MSIYMVDSSGIVKRYVKEIGSAWILNITDVGNANEIFIARITAVEVVSALARRVLGGAINKVDADSVIAQFQSDLQNEYQVVEITDSLIDRAMALAVKHGLRGYDAVQLAAACELQQIVTSCALAPLTFVSADHDLIQAATTEGLIADDPQSHP